MNKIFDMKSIVVMMLNLVGGVTIDITNEKILKKCTVDDIDFECNNGQIHFAIENCRIDDSTLFKAVGSTNSKCSINSHQMELDSAYCGTTETLNENEMIYTITLGQFLTEEGIIFNKQRTFGCKVPRKHVVSAGITIKKPLKGEYKQVGNIFVAKHVVENDVVTESGTRQPRNDIAEVTTSDDLIEEDGFMYGDNSVGNTLNFFIISLNFILILP